MGWHRGHEFRQQRYRLPAFEHFRPTDDFGRGLPHESAFISEATLAAVALAEPRIVKDDDFPVLTGNHVDFHHVCGRANSLSVTAAGGRPNRTDGVLGIHSGEPPVRDNVQLVAVVVFFHPVVRLVRMFAASHGTCRGDDGCGGSAVQEGSTSDVR